MSRFPRLVSFQQVLRLSANCKEAIKLSFIWLKFVVEFLKPFLFEKFLLIRDLILILMSFLIQKAEY